MRPALYLSTSPFSSSTPCLFSSPSMPNKYSHALVLSHYESRGLIDLHNHPTRPLPASSSVSADGIHPRRHRNLPPATRAPPTPSPASIKPTPPTTAAPRSSVVPKPTPPTTSAPPRAVFEDSPPSTPDPPPSNIRYKYAPPPSRSSRRSSLDQRPPPPTTTALPASSRGYKHILSETPIRPCSSLEYPPAPTAATRSSALKEIPRNVKIRPRVSLNAADTCQTATALPHPFSGFKALPENTQSPSHLSVDSNDALSTATSSIPRPRAAVATPTTTSRPTSRPRSLTTTPSFQSSRSSHHTADSIITQIYAPDPISPPPTPPCSSTSFETAVLAPKSASPKFLPRREPPAIPPRSSSIPRPPSSSIHHPDFDTFSSANSPTMSSANSTFTSTSSFHQTPRTSYSRITSSLPSKSPDREPEFNPDTAPAPDPETVPFSQGPTAMSWENLDELPTIFRHSISSEHYDLEAPNTRRSSFDEAAPPPITRLPRTRDVPPTATKKPRRLSLTLFRSDCEAISYDRTVAGPAPIPVATAKDSVVKERNSAVIEREYAKRTSKRTSWSLMSRISAVRDPFEDTKRGRGFSRAAGTGYV